MAAPTDLNLLRAFARVHEAGSFSAAADKLGVPRSTVSRAIAALEDAAGVALFHRTTRRVSTTQEGLALFDRVASALGALDEALAELPERREEPSGTLRVTSTVDLGVVVLAEAVARFSARYPKVTTDVLLSPNVVDLARENVDVALRVTAGSLRGGALVARKVGDVSVQIFAAPSYLARRGQPRATGELAEHDWVGRQGGRGAARVVSGDMLFVREVLRKGGGLGGLPTFLAGDDVASGALVRVLPKVELDRARVFLVTRARKHVPARVEAFRGLVVEMLRQRPLAPPAARPAARPDARTAP